MGLIERLDKHLQGIKEEAFHDLRSTPHQGKRIFDVYNHIITNSRFDKFRIKDLEFSIYDNNATYLTRHTNYSVYYKTDYDRIIVWRSNDFNKIYKYPHPLEKEHCIEAILRFEQPQLSINRAKDNTFLNIKPDHLFTYWPELKYQRNPSVKWSNNPKSLADSIFDVMREIIYRGLDQVEL